MLVITDNEVRLTRGDNADIIVQIKDLNGDTYELQEGDKLLFTMKRNCKTDIIVIQKDITSNQIISIEHNDTKDLDYGTYYFDVQCTLADGNVYTVIEPHPFIIEKEVTFNV